MAAPVIDVSRTGYSRAATDAVTSTANAAAVITYGASGGRVHVLDGVTFSYSGDPTGGRLTVAVAGTTRFSVAITKGGPGPIPFDPPIRSGVGEAMVVTLAAGGGSLTGDLCCAHRVE